MSIKEISFCMSPNGNNNYNEKLNITQFDHGATLFVIQLFPDVHTGFNMDISLYSDIKATFIKRNGFIYTSDVSIIDQANGVIGVKIHKDITDEIGVIKLNLNLRNGNELIVFKNFKFYIIDNPITL